MACRIQGFTIFLRPQSVRLIIHPLRPLIFHGIALVLKLGLIYRRQQKAHAVGFKPQYFFKLISRYTFKVIGPVCIGGSVQGSAGFSDDPEVFFISNML